MTGEDILKIFEENGALLKGHFLLTSGLHSDCYLQSALTLQHPAVAEELCAELAAKVKADPNISRIDLVIAPALGGVIVAHEVARALGVGVRAIFTERQEKTMTMRRGFQIKPGERCLVVEDVITTGGSTREVIEVVEKYGGVAVGAGSLIDRSLKSDGSVVDLGLPRRALAALEVATYAPEECPMCREGSIAIKPGSRR